MKYGETFILLVLAIFLFSLTGVFASEMDTPVASDDSGQLELSVNEEIIEDNLQTSEENTKLAVEENDGPLSSENALEILAEGQLTYSDLKRQIGSGGNIKLTKGTYTYNDVDGDTIRISNSGVINGNGAVIDMAQSGHRAFDVSASGVTIRDLTIKNANYGGDGGAIYFSSSGTVTNCNFTNNSASRDGGAIKMGSGTVSNCNFINNSASRDGGAVNMGSGTVTNCNFTDNSVSEWGGAIYMSSGSVKNCNFTNNFVAGENSWGGAIYMPSGSVENCNFADNHANLGGAVYFDSQSTLINCNFTGNKASYGGAIFMSSSGNVENCNFTNNLASADGGAVFFTDEGTVKNCNFVNNSVSEEGGAIRMSSGTLSNCNFTGNKANYGGAIFISQSGTVTNCNFTNNQATGADSWGGAIYFFDKGNVSNCIFTDNTARYGGTIRFSGEGTVTNCNFTDNEAYVGGAVYFDVEGTVKNCNFINNSVTGENSWGGAIFMYSGSVENCKFTGNNATTGSAIYFYSTSASKTVSNSRFLNNRANAEELQVTKYENNITIIFIGNNNLLNAIYSRDDSEVTFTNVTYWSINRIANTGSSPTIPSRSNKETGQNITVSVIVNDKLVLSDVISTDENGMIVLDIIAGDNYYIAARHDTNSYYTEAETINSTMKFSANVTPQTTHNKTVNITAKSNIFSEVIPGKLLFIVPNSDQIIANYAGNGTWWTLHTFDDYDDYQVNAIYVGFDDVTINNAIISISKTPTNITVENTTVDLFVGGFVATGATLTPADAGNLTFTSSNSSVAKVEDGNIIAVSEGTAVITVSFAGSEDYAAAENKTIAITVSLYDASVSVNNSTLDLLVDDTFTIVPTTNPDGLTVTFVQDDSGVYSIDDNGVVTALKEGTGSVLVKVGGDGFYAENSTSVSVTVSKVPTEINLVNSTVDLKVNDEIEAGATLTPAVAGNVTFTSSNSSVAKVKDGKIIALSEGTAVITVSFAGDDKYAAADNKTISVTVSLYDASVSVNNSTLDLLVSDEFILVVITTPKGLDVTFTPDNSGVVSVDENGVVTALKEGSATVKVSVGGDGVYALNTTDVSITVSKIPTEINLVNSTLDLKVNDEIEAGATLTPADAGNVTFTSSNSSIATVDTKGIVKAVAAGKVNITVSFSGDDKYATAENKTITVTVSLKDASISAKDIELNVGDNTTIDVTVVPEGLEVTYVPDSSGVVTVENGIVVAVKEGTAKITITVGGDGVYALNSTTITVTVNKHNTTLDITIPSDITFGEDSSIEVKLPSDAEGNVTLKVDGKVVDIIPVTNGTASVKLPELIAGNHSVEITYSGDDKYKASSKNTTVTVNKASTKISAENVTATYNVNKYLVINLTDSKGNPMANAKISVNLNGAKDYTTDKNGQVKIKVSTLVPKTYTVKITFAGNENYTGSDGSAKVVVKKATPKITATNKMFKTATKTKKYKITLKDNTGKVIKNAKVTLKVNGKTYTAKTNSKGKAIFKITKLNKKGTFKAAITYKGSKYYNKVTKKVSIKVISSWKTVSKGSKVKSTVKEIQIALKNHGYYLTAYGHYLKVDGIYWVYTVKAVKQFQKAKVLKVTGKVDENTADKLGII